MIHHYRLSKRFLLAFDWTKTIISIAHILNSPIALHWWWSVGAVDVWHLLVIVKGEDPPDNKVTLGHKAWRKAFVKRAHIGCRWRCRGDASNCVISYGEDTDRVKQGK